MMDMSVNYEDYDFVSLTFVENISKALILNVFSASIGS